MKKTMLIVVAGMSLLMAACSNREQPKVTDNTVTEEKTNVVQSKLEQEQQENNSAHLDPATEVEVSSDYSTINIIKLTKEEIKLKKENMEDPNTSIRLRYGIKPAEYGIPAGENGTSFTFFADGSNAHFLADDQPYIQLNIDDPVEIAKAYVQLYDSWKWSGTPTIYNGHRVYFNGYGEIEIDDVPTGIKCNEGILYDKAKTAYLNEQWDGTLAILDSHYIELSGGGDLLIDGYDLLIDGYLSGERDNLDVPKSAYNLFGDEIPDFEYVPGQGVYAIIDKKLVKFLRGEQITLPGERLSWKGVQNFKDLISQKLDLYYLPYLIYNEIDEKLYLISADKTCTLDNYEKYVYVFDDYNISKMTYLGKVNFEHQYPRDVSIEAVINQK